MPHGHDPDQPSCGGMLDEIVERLAGGNARPGLVRAGKPG